MCNKKFNNVVPIGLLLFGHCHCLKPSLFYHNFYQNAHDRPFFVLCNLQHVDHLWQAQLWNMNCLSILTIAASLFAPWKSKHLQTVWVKMWWIYFQTALESTFVKTIWYKFPGFAYIAKQAGVSSLHTAIHTIQCRLTFGNITKGWSAVLWTF